MTEEDNSLITLNVEESSLVGEYSNEQVREMFKSLNYKLPKQVYHHFKEAPLKELKLVALAYGGDKKEPSFQEWIEAYQQNKFVEKIRIFDDRGIAIRKMLDVAEKEVSLAREQSLDSDGMKPLLQEVKRLNSLLGSNEDYLVMLHEKLNKFVTEQLKREAPKQLEVTHKSITPGDVANLLHTARQETIDADFEEVKDD